MKKDLTSKEVANMLGVSVSTILRTSKKLKSKVKYVKRGTHRKDRLYNQQTIKELSELLKVNIQTNEKATLETVTSDSLVIELKNRIDSLEQDKKNYIKQIESLTAIINNTNETVKQINQTIQGNMLLSGGDVLKNKKEEKEPKGNWFVRLMNKKII